MTLPGATVDEVLEEARVRFGDQFAAVLAISRVWVNGHPAELAITVSHEDEVAVLPPVSGGSE